MADNEEIAIVGVGCRFPGADNVKEYWRVLRNGENHVKEVPRDRWKIDAFYDPDRNAPGKTYVRNAGFVSSVDEWDHRFYGINDMEAELVDPQQRLVLDCVHMALEDGGITRKDIEGTQTGVYIGSMGDDYKGHVIADTTISSTYSVTGTHNSIISARVSYTYNLSGPAMTLDTACSSSLVAIDVASQALLTRKCSMAICGGVNILMDPQLFVALSKAGMLSPSGQCKTFTNEADGYARGEGCGIVLLKTLKDAEKNGNKIWSTIKTGTNQDGHMTAPITAPSGLRQEQLIKQLYESHCVDKARIQVIEAHGTGTTIGDPTEANALGAHFGKRADAKEAVMIGSVKTNIGHLEAAAGVAGLIKVLLMMKFDIVVPSLWYNKDNENPKVKLSEHGFVVPTHCMPWERSCTRKRLACVNSFGFGGTNAHCIVEEYWPSVQFRPKLPVTESFFPFIIVISAFDKKTLFANVQLMYDTLKVQAYDMDALSYTSTCRRDHRPQRKAIYGRSQDDIIVASNAFLNMKEDVVSPLDSKKIIFVFCGVGTAWKCMCSSLMNVDAFKEAIFDIDQYLQPLSGWMISKQFIECNDILSNPMEAHIAIFACQVGLAALWKVLGIVPDVVIGQSVGEVAAAYIAGYVDLQTAVKIIFERSKFLAAAKGGTMAVVRHVDVDIVEQYCKTSGSVTIAVYSSPKSCTVSGMTDDIQKLEQKLSKMEDIKAEITYLDVQCAYHSPHVESAANQIATQLQNIQYFQGHTSMLSTVTGKLDANSSFATSSYWEKNVKMPVLFSNAIMSVESKSRHNVFLELGPSPVLSAHIDNILEGKTNYTVIPSMQKQNEMNTMTGAICTIYELGLDLNWEYLHPNQSHLTDIPTNQFRKFRQLYQSPSAVKKNQGVDTLNAEHLYIKQLSQKNDGSHFKAEISETTTPFVFQHIVAGFIILPGAAYADVGFEIGCNVLGLSKESTLVSLEFLRPVRVEPGVKTILHISTVAQRNELLFHVKQNHVTMCKGWVRSAEVQLRCEDKFDIEYLKLSILGCKQMHMEEMYEKLESMGFRYGSYFKLMRNCVTNGVESLTQIEVPDFIINESESTTLHPCVLDSMMQSTINNTTEEIWAKIKEENLIFLPVAIGELRVFGTPESKMYMFTRRINTTILDTVLQVHYNVLLLNHNGIVVADLRNYTSYGKRNGSLAPCELKYRLTWQPLGQAKQTVNVAANMLVLTNTPTKDIYKELEEFENITVCQNKENQAKEDFIANAFKPVSNDPINIKPVDKVLLLIQKHELDNDITASTASDIHECVKDNCMLLTELVKYMTNNRITVPLYVATQNTQPMCSAGKSSINLVGEELWGFVRSIHLEFIHGEITLIDLQPSFKETKQSLVNFICHTCNSINQTKPEIIILYNEIFGAQFTKVPRKEVIPTLRVQNRNAEKVITPHKLLALRSKRMKNFILTPPMKIDEKHGIENVILDIKTVCLHPLSVYPRTTSGIGLDQDVWQDNLNDGHSVFGLEYTGVQVSRPTQGSSFRKPELELLTIFPSEIMTQMSVPKCCTVSLREIPSYQPGLVLYTLLSWKLSECVPYGSSVAVYSPMESSVPKLILESLTRTQRNACLVDPSSVYDDNQKWIDILITIEQIDSSFPLLGRCKKIVCLEGCISEPARVKISRSAEQTIKSVSAAKLLGMSHVSECLTNVVTWLQENNEKILLKRTTSACSDSQDSSADDNSCKIPCSTLDVMKDDRVVIPIRNPINKLFRKSAVYIVTGGLTGLGWEVIRLLAEMGAGIIASICRREVSPEKSDDILKVEKATECKIICVRGDVTDLRSVSTAIKEIESLSSNSPIRGVFHGAGVLQGKLLMSLEESQLDFVLRPKVIGTMNMHIATKEMDLDYFVVPSSINSLIGSPGQSNYGAANSFLDTFMEWRRRRGLPGQAINWGALSVGMASRPEFVENFTKRGFNLLSVHEIRSCLQDALMHDSTSIIYTDINWDIHAKDYTNPKLERTRLQLSVLIDQAVSHVMNFDNDGIDNMSFDVETLQNAGKERQLLAISQVIQKVSSKVIGGDLNQINISNTLSEMAFDSMSTVTFINIVHGVTGHRIPPSFMLNTSHTLNDIAMMLFDEMFAGKKDPEETTKTICDRSLPPSKF